MDVDRSELISSLGGEAAVKDMSHEARADALEDYLAARLQAAVAARQSKKTYPTVADYENRVDRRGYRRGVGRLFVHEHSIQDPDAEPSRLTVPRLEQMPPTPTLIDFFEHRFMVSAHLLQSARIAHKRGASEEVVLACLLHDAGQNLMKADHGYWGAQIIEPYVSERVAFAVRYHQALRFFPDPSLGYEYPETYYRIFGVDYVPLPHIARAYDYARTHKWYMDARLVTLNDPGFDRRVHRHHRAPFPAAQGRARQRQYTRQPHVADDDQSGCAAVNVPLRGCVTQRNLSS
jgi:hypothetical protein